MAADVAHLGRLGLQAIKGGHISQHLLASLTGRLASTTFSFVGLFSPDNTLSTQPRTAYTTDSTDVHSLCYIFVFIIII